jgi:DNA-binding CsgD family transcriptional regulator
LERAHRALVRLPDAGTIPVRLANLEQRRRLDPRLDTLSPAEKRILRLLPSHRTLEEIGGELFISRSTVKSHVSHIYAKLGVTSRAAAVAVLHAAATRAQPEPTR